MKVYVIRVLETIEPEDATWEVANIYKHKEQAEKKVETLKQSMKYITFTHNPLRVPLYQYKVEEWDVEEHDMARMDP